MSIANKGLYSDAKVFDEVAYVSQKPRKLKTLLGDDLNVHPTFAYNPKSKTAPETAMRWAKYYTTDKEYEPVVTTTQNHPFQITIVDIDVRAEGGRAYKVVDNQGWLFDLREDQIIDVVAQCGIQPGGVIPATFVWGNLGSATRLLLVGGKIYNAAMERAEKVKTSTTMKTADFVSGKIYRRLNDNNLLYLGRVLLPGDKEKSFAFVELGNGDNYAGHRDWKDKAWAKLTLAERVERVDTDEDLRYYRDIVTFRTVPKNCVAVVGEVTTDMVHKIANEWRFTSGEAIASHWYAAKGHPMPEDRQSHNSFLGYEQQKRSWEETRRLQQQFALEAYRAWKAELVWS